jgi:hypothetical protein
VTNTWYEYENSTKVTVIRTINKIVAIQTIALGIPTRDDKLKENFMS